jgi:hypothetical protein
VLQWDLAANEVANLDDLRAHLAAHNGRFVDRPGEIYVPPQEHLATLLGRFVEAYPASAGFSIAEPGSDSDQPGAREHRLDEAPAHVALEQGPRVHDVAVLVTRRGRLACVVLEHVEADAPRGALSAPSADARAEAGHDVRVRQVLRSATDSLHFGSSRLSRGGRRYLYQSVPGLEAGKRDTERRWRHLSALLAQHDLTVEGRVVFDVGCNAGMMLAHALADGAYWGVGWDRPHVAAAAERVQYAMGNTRTTIVGADLDEAYPLTRDIPPHLGHRTADAILLYLAVWRHLGLLRDIQDLPWSTLLFEGHQGESSAQRARVFREVEQRWGCRLLASTMVSDGDSDARPVALFARR